MRVMITREEELAQPYAACVAAMGGEAVVHPLYRYNNIKAVLPDPSLYNALVFTSAYGVSRFAALSSRRDLPVYAVGPQTAAEAGKQGFQEIYQADGTGKSLACLLRPDDGPYLYARAREISYPLAAHVEGLIETVLYETVPVEELDWPYDVDMVLFFSARAAQIFVKLAENKALTGGFSQTKALCLGAGMVEFLSALRWQDISVAPQPDRAGMMELLKIKMGKT